MFVFRQDGEIKKKEVPFQGNICKVPILQNTIAVAVGVSSGNLRTTTGVAIPCRHSVQSGACAHYEPEPDIYNEILQIVNEIAGSKADKGTTLAEYGITDAYIKDGSVVLGKDKLTPVSQDVLDEIAENKADKGTTLAEYGITDAYIKDGSVVLGNESLTPVLKAGDGLKIVLNEDGKAQIEFDDTVTFVIDGGTSI